jgi:putative membrane protein
MPIPYLHVPRQKVSACAKLNSCGGKDDMNKELKNLLIIGGIILAVLIIVPAVFGAVTGVNGDGFGMMRGFGWGMVGIGFVVMIAFWSLVIWGIVSLIRWFASTAGSNPTHQGASALEILKQRYARGEINKEEFEQKKKDLGG